MVCDMKMLGQCYQDTLRARCSSFFFVQVIGQNLAGTTSLNYAIELISSEYLFTMTHLILLLYIVVAFGSFTPGS